MLTSEKTYMESKFNNTWLVLLALSSVLFYVLGFVMVLADSKYISGLMYLVSAIIFTIAMINAYKNKIDFSNHNPYFNMGFIFTVVGLNINPAVWSLGIIFFIVGLFKDKK